MGLFAPIRKYVDTLAYPLAQQDALTASRHRAFIAPRLLGSLVVKPENMLRNLERSGGVVLSEAVMMAVAEKIGRDRAHVLVLEISRDAAARKVSFRDAVAAHPEVRRRLSPRRLAAALDYRNSLGLATEFVDRVAAAHQAERRGRRRRR